MTHAGGISLFLPSENGAPARLHYRAPADVTSLLARVPADQVPALVRRLFAICSEAQGHAAELALAAARGEAIASAELAAAEVKGWVEIVREHGLRIALDWARLLDKAPDHDAARAFMAGAQGQDADFLSNLIAKHVTAMPVEDWLQLSSVSDLAGWAQRGGSIAADFLHSLMKEPVLAEGAMLEPGSLAARQADHPLLAEALATGAPVARHVARLIDLARAPGRIRELQAGEAVPVRGFSLRAGEGMARVPCARGRLEHEVQLEDGHIVRYHILSPTERLFAPGGNAEWQFRKLGSVKPARRALLAEMMMQALDPCVDYQIEGA